MIQADLHASLLPPRFGAPRRGRLKDPFKTLTSLAAIGFGVALLTSPANAVPDRFCLTSPGFQVHEAGYSNRGKRRSLYVEDYYAPNYAGRTYRSMPYGGSDEIRELQRFHPEDRIAQGNY